MFLPTKTIMKHLLLSFDLEELNKDTALSSEGLIPLLNLLKKYKISCTFFTTWFFAKKHPELINKIIKNNHEIALHALNHNDDYSKLTCEEALKSLKLAKENLEKKFKIKIYGFRAPNMHPPSNEVLECLNLVYDSSLHPTFLPGHYNNFLKKRKPFRINNLIEIPVSVTPFFRAPFSWFWFRLFGLTYSKICTKLTLINSNYILLYFHPWEFSNNLKEKGIFSINSGKNLLNLLEGYICWCINRNLKPTSIISCIKNDTFSKTIF